MRVLVLTSINPIIAGTTYARLDNHFKEKKPKIHYLCFPFFAEMDVQTNGKEYIPTLFAMMKTSMTQEMQRKLYDKKNMIVIGNTYKEQKFDIVVALDEMDHEVFDGYLESLRQDSDLEDFNKLAKTDKLYGIEDAEIVLPTMEHLILFLENAFYPKEEKD